jgi:hypothetical protein
MRKILLLVAVVLAGQLLQAQPKPTDLDKSPMDVSYYPPNYPILKMRGQANGEPSARIIYSRPQKKGREIFGQEVKYNEVWRLGANEATELELFKNAVIAGKNIPRGRYGLFCIPSESKWTIILNKDNYSWGSFAYKKEKDFARIEVPVQKNDEITEALTMYFEKNNLVILWDYIKVNVPVNL